jgi:glycine/betaine/sarcosine/D-proline reductase family selenoprotein B
MKKAVLYINQFFAGIGGEEFADHEPEIREGLTGPALALNGSLKNAEITHTIICGDNFMGSNTEEAVKRILDMLTNVEFDIFFAGPAFQAGRYGVACGTICKRVKETFNVEAITSMNEENPGVDMFKKDVYIFPGGKSAAAMRKDTEKMAKLGDKILDGQTMFSAEEEGFFPRGIRHQVWLEDNTPAADRAVEMLLKKLSGEPFVSELPIPKSDRVPIAKPITDLSKARIALVTSGGIVPVDNPDKIQSASATRWGRYDISNIDRLEAGVFKTIHAGYDPAAADADPNVCAPVDVMRDFEKKGVIGKLDDHLYATVGTGTTEAEAQRMAKEMVPFFKKDCVNAIILTST